MDIKEAENKIAGCKVGSFLVRCSSRNPGEFTLSFSHKKYKSQTVHCRIPQEYKYNLERFVKMYIKQKKIFTPVPLSPYTAIFKEAQVSLYFQADYNINEQPKDKKVKKNDKDTNDESHFSMVNDKPIPFIP
eukprot:TRINITY_DN7070_c0_g1_i2.p2 TRINITY_DN7070_c0_g1~~TRINITY_DN7070_c0_g1_i2.p2  ORF type:complete len:132 (-),score=16.53 TRINITY_DN7070_c0_g1_i2:77-472(-)